MKKILFVIFSVPMVLYFLVIIVILVFRAFGYPVNSSTGTSMYPAMSYYALTIRNETVPFEKLKVGDIIVYRERVGSHFSHNQYRSPWWKINDPVPTASPAPTTSPAPLYKDEGIEYKPRDCLVHRIIEVIDGPGDRALICQGDNNPKADPFPVMKSGYIGKVVWYSNELGPVFNAVYGSPLMLVPMAVLGILGYMLIRTLPKEEKEE